MKKLVISCVAMVAAWSAWALERVNLWPEGKMPYYQDHQV